MRYAREMELRKIIRDEVAYVIKEDLDGQAETFKNAWEYADTNEEQKVMKAELRRLLRMVKP